ncbi:hypothetical protein [Rhizobium sp. OAE497]|uniref:hypothetical protein n=1 Tax=Rhizobium sp. OAE497 TaxID=2663796 RepID=UPI0018F4C932
MSRIFKIVVALALLPALAGCTPSVAGTPNLTEYQAVSDRYFASAFSTQRLATYEAVTDPGRRQSLRNSIVLGAIGTIDLRYAKFVNRLTQESQIVPFGATVTSISLSTAGALTGSEAAKTTLAAVDTAIKGGVAAYDKSILADRTIQALQKQMQANRNRVRSAIIAKLSESTLSYPLELAMIDVNEYAAAGTITAGMATIDEQAAQNLAVSEDEKVERIYAYAADETTAAIIEFMNTGNPAVLAAVNAAAANARVTAPFLIYDAGQAANRRKLLTTLKALPAKPA